MKTDKQQQKNKKQKIKYPLDMKLSVIRLFMAENFSLLLTLYISMLVCEAAVFWILGLRSKPLFIETAVSYARIALYFIMGVSFVLMCLILSNTLTSKSGKPVYTIQRLRVDEACIFRLNSIYNTLAFVCYLGFQSLAILLMMLLFNAGGLGNGGPQNMFMAMYRTPFFHSVVPMGNTLYLIRNIIFIISLGILTAVKSQAARDGKNSYSMYFAAIAIALTFIYVPLEATTLVFRVRDMAALFIVVPTAWVGFDRGNSHRERSWSNDEFESSIAEYRNEDENK